MNPHAICARRNEYKLMIVIELCVTSLNEYVNILFFFVCINFTLKPTIRLTAQTAEHTFV